MTKDEIVSLLRRYHQCEIELAIVEGLSCEIDRRKPPLLEAYSIIQKRLSLMNHWLTYLSIDEATVLRLHLIDGLPWSKMTTSIRKEQREGIPYDPRSLQRVQQRALGKIQKLMINVGNALDYLL